MSESRAAVAERKDTYASRLALLGLCGVGVAGDRSDGCARA